MKIEKLEINPHVGFSIEINHIMNTRMIKYFVYVFRWIRFNISTWRQILRISNEAI